MKTLEHSTPAMAVAEDIFVTYPLATMIVVNNNEGLPLVRQLPVVYDPKQQRFYAHISAQNPINASLKQDNSLLTKLVFHAEQGYVSPTWSSHIKVPTWDYCVVHIDGQLSRVNEVEQKQTFLNQQVSHYESQWNINELTTAQSKHMLNAIEVICLTITSMQYQYKMSQNKPQDGKVAILNNVNDHSPLFKRYQQLWQNN